MSERKREGVVHLLGSRRTRMRVCTHSGAFERLSRDMHARTHACTPGRARVCVRAFRGARMASSGGKMVDARGAEGEIAGGHGDEGEERRIMRVST